MYISPTVFIDLPHHLLQPSLLLCYMDTNKEVQQNDKENTRIDQIRVILNVWPVRCGLHLLSVLNVEIRFSLLLFLRFKALCCHMHVDVRQQNSI